MANLTFVPFTCDKRLSFEQLDAAARDINASTNLDEQISKIQELSQAIRNAGYSNVPVILQSLGINTSSPASMMVAMIHNIGMNNIGKACGFLSKFSRENTIKAFRTAMREAVKNENWAAFHAIVLDPKFLNMANVKVGSLPPEFLKFGSGSAYRERQRERIQYSERVQNKEAALEIFIIAVDLCQANGRFDILGDLCDNAKDVAFTYFSTKILGGKLLTKAIGTEKFPHLFEIAENLQEKLPYKMEKMKAAHQEKVEKLEQARIEQEEAEKISAPQPHAIPAFGFGDPAMLDPTIRKARNEAMLLLQSNQPIQVVGPIQADAYPIISSSNQF